jgi:hypothetical protein
MTDAAESKTRFRVYARDLDHHAARFIEEVSFEAAAIAYLENFPLAAPIGGEHGLRVMVQDLETGHQHCFTLDLESGETTPCG